MSHHQRDERPMLHFTAPKNWLNDANGVIFFKDRYHLFYQHNPHAPVWSRPHWGHATSTDLLSWTHQPIALYPDQVYDAAGCYSGCCVDDGGTPTILYTAVREGEDGTLTETVGLATSDDDLASWTKRPEPVIDGPPPGYGASGFRDPFVYRHADGTWRLILGSGSPQDGAVVLQYSSPDLRRWRYLGVLISQRDLPSGFADASLWECPQLVRLTGRDVLLVSRHNGSPLDVLMITGVLGDRTFEPAHTAVMDQGPSWYAPHAFASAEHRQLTFGWLRDNPADPTQGEAGWAGTLSLPREIYLNEDGVAATRPARQVLSLRRPDDGRRAPDGRESLDFALPSAQTEVQIRFSTVDRLLLAQLPQTSIASDGDDLQISLEWPPTASVTDGIKGLSPSESIESRPTASDEPVAAPLWLHLQVIIDGAIVETFLDNGGSAKSIRLTPWHLRFHRLRIRTNNSALQVSLVYLQTLNPSTRVASNNRTDISHQAHWPPTTRAEAAASPAQESA